MLSFGNSLPQAKVTISSMCGYTAKTMCSLFHMYMVDWQLKRYDKELSQRFSCPTSSEESLLSTLAAETL